MNVNRHRIFNIGIDKVNKEEALCKIREFVKDKKAHIVVTANLITLLEARRDEQFHKIINSADLVTPDGASILWLARLFKIQLKERVTGIDLMLTLCNIAEKENYTIFLLGAQEEVVNETVKVLQRNYNNLKIVGYHHGYFDDEKRVVELINNKKPDILFVAMGQPKQEKFISNHLPELNAKVAIGVGGAFDVISGKIKRAPLFIQNIGLEWLYRIIQQPERILRLLKKVSSNLLRY